MYNFYSICSIILKLLNYSLGSSALGSGSFSGFFATFLSVKNFLTFSSYTFFSLSILCPHHDGMRQYGLFSFATTQMIEKKSRLTQKAAAKLRVAMNITVKNSAGRIQGAAKNSSCFFVNSKARKRPPKLRTNMKQPIIYGFVFINVIAWESGSKTPPAVG